VNVRQFVHHLECEINTHVIFPIIPIFTHVIFPKSQSVRRRARRRQTANQSNQDEVIDKPIVISDYIKEVGGVHGKLIRNIVLFNAKNVKVVEEDFFWGLETSIVNAFILYTESEVRDSSKPINHKNILRELLM
jgi:hypothetical protein